MVRGDLNEVTASPPPPPQVWFCHLPNLKILTDYIVNVTATQSERSSSYLSSFMLEDIREWNNPEALGEELAPDDNSILSFFFLQ